MKQQKTWMMLVALGVATLVGCSGDDDVETDAVTGTEPSLEPEGTDATEGDDGGGGDEGDSFADFESPLQAALGVSSDPEQMQQQMAEQERERQQLVAECMAEQGFEYTPIDTSQVQVFGAGGDFGERDYVEEYGFGISTTFLEGFGGPAEGFEDPNVDYVSSLSPEEQEAYNTALYGDLSGVGEGGEGGAIEITPGSIGEQGGCFGEALNEVQDPFQELFTEFGDELQELFERVQADPRITQANAQWSECIADAGYTYSSPEEIFEDLNERMAPLYEAAFGAAPPAVGGGGGAVGGIVIQGGSASETQLTPEQQSELEAIQAYELEVALANYDCQQPLLQATFEVQAEYEQQFLDENRDTIDELLAD